jgi:3-hydroxyisobutyrate dehydrogenase-like beta-hydroxyacid dehydrogenase
MDVAFLGLGIMGSRMAANLRRAGHELRVWTRSPGKAEAWADEHGGRAAATPAQAAEGAQAVVSIVVDGPQVAAVLTGEEGAMHGAAPGTLFVDMSTIGPAAARDVHGSLAAAGHRFVDAPVTGSSPKAEDGTLTIMAGGDAADVEEARALFDAMGSLVVHAGPVGHGQLVKVINNTVAAANAAVVAQALLVGRAAGADLDALVEVMQAGSGASAMLALKAAPMRAHDYETLFKTAHMRKDVDLCLAESGAAGVPFPAGAAVREALVAAEGAGHADADFAALLTAYEGLAGVTL